MKRLISFILCAAMLVSMVVTAVNAENWGDNGVWGSTNLIKPEYEQVYASNGIAVKFDSTGSNSRLYVQTFDGTDVQEMTGEFYYFFGTYITAVDSTKDSYIGMGNGDSNVNAYYNFDEKKFVISKGSGWNFVYSTDIVTDGTLTLDYDLPLNQWFNFGVHFTPSLTEILLNGEVVLSANYGYTDGTAWLFWPDGVAGYLDNLNMYDVTENQHYGARNYPSDTTSYTTSWISILPSTGSFSIVTSETSIAGNCGMQWARDLISTAYNAGTGVTEAQITAANNAWNALSPSQKSTIATEGYNHLIAKANAYYYATNSTEATNAKNLINAIGTVSYPDSATAIANARTAYDTVMAYSYDTGYNNDVTESWIDNALSDVMASYASTLEAAEATYAELEATQGEAAQNQAAADAVIAKINAIGTVTYTDISKGKIDDARTAYNALTADQQALVSNYSTLTAAETTYANLKAEADANQAAADAVIAMINAIGTVTLDDADAIEAARAAYDALTAAQKALVTNYSTLTSAETAYANLKAADSVINIINQIPQPVVYNNLCKNAIDDARSAYNALTADQQTLVTNYSILTAAETEYARLEAAAADQAAADEVIAEINALPATITLDNAGAVAAARAAYDALSAAQQALVSNIDVLEAAEVRIAELTEAKVAADAVAAQINAIGTVTLASGDAITAAENAYAALSDDAKAYVTNYNTLTTARTSYNELVVSDFNTRATEELNDVTIANKADLEALVVEYNELKAAGLSPTATILPRLNSAISRISGYETAVQNVKDLIDAIGTVTSDSGADIEAAETAYAALSTQEQKDLVTNYQTLIDARKTYDALLEGDAVESASAVNKVKATSLIISDSLAINYKITVDPAYEIVGMEFTLDGNTTVVADYTTDANGYLVFRFDNIAPDLMAETITSVIIVKDSEGTEIRCNPAEYSIAKYANNKIATEGLTELLASMVNYGDAAAAYTGTYTVPSTVITDWSVYEDSAAPVRDYTSIQAIGTDLASPSVTWGSASLILSDSVDIRIKIDGAIEDSFVAKTVYGGEEITFDIVTEDGVSYFVWDIYNAAQMSSEVTFTIYDAADGSAVSNTLTYGVESYVADMLATSQDEKLADLLTAMMQYGDAALAYKKAVNG